MENIEGLTFTEKEKVGEEFIIDSSITLKKIEARVYDLSITDYLHVPDNIIEQELFRITNCSTFIIEKIHYYNCSPIHLPEAKNSVIKKVVFIHNKVIAKSDCWTEEHTYDINYFDNMTDAEIYKVLHERFKEVSIISIQCFILTGAEGL